MLNGKSEVKAIVFDPSTEKTSPVTTVQFDVSKEEWKLIGEFQSVEQTRFIFDGNPESAWLFNSKVPVDIILDLSKTLDLTGFTYIPDQGRWSQGIISRYELYVSNDGRNWGQPVSEGEFANIKNSPVKQKIDFDQVKGRYVKFRALAPAEDDGRMGIAEFDVVTN